MPGLTRSSVSQKIVSAKSGKIGTGEHVVQRRDGGRVLGLLLRIVRFFLICLFQLQQTPFRIGPCVKSDKRRDQLPSCRHFQALGKPPLTSLGSEEVPKAAGGDRSSVSPAEQPVDLGPVPSMEERIEKGPCK